ncbi:MAG: thioredoxin domain-containing protein [Actinomycetaceae bacterium]|nr:thioredoxin domain-containing protein [Actinomycetaceae bacterium]
MAKKGASTDATRLKAQEMRQKQAQKEKQTRAIIFAVVGVLLAITVIAVIWVITQSNAQKQENQVEGSGDGTVTSMVVSAEGTGVADPAVPTLQEYFDYSCHACANMETMIGPEMWTAVENGEINLELIPVNVVRMAWQFPTAHAAFLIYENEPEKFADFHHEAHSFFHSQFTAGDASIIQDEAKSLEKVKEIATEVGVSSELVDKFTADGANDVLETNTQAWSEADVEGRDGLGTPEYVSGGKQIRISGNNAEEVAQMLLDGVKAAN